MELIARECNLHVNYIEIRNKNQLLIVINSFLLEAVMAVKLTTLMLVFVVYAFIGWLTEVIYAYSIERKWINRGFLFGPFCPIYGVGAIAILSIVESINQFIIVGREMSLIQMFFMVLIVTSTIEWLTGYFLEKMFHAKWWDYSDKKFNIMGYVCLRFSIYWAVIGVVVIKVINPLIMKGISLLEGPFYIPVGILFAAYFAVDGYKTVRGMIDLRNLILELEKLSAQLRVDLDRVSQPLRLEVERIRSEAIEKRKALSSEIKERIEDFNDEIVDKIEQELKERIEFVENNLREAIEKRQNEAAIVKGEIAERIYDLRLYRAFPKMKSMRHPELLRPVRELYQKKRNSK